MKRPERISLKRLDCWPLTDVAGACSSCFDCSSMSRSRSAAGAAILSWSGEGLRLSWGSLLIAATYLAWGIDNNLSRKLSASDPVQIAAIKGMAAGSVNTVIAIWLGAGAISPPLAVSGAVIGFLGMGVSLVFFMLGLRHLGTARTGAYFSLAPFIGALFSILILGDPITPWLAIAAVLMAAGLWLHLAERHEHEHIHEEIEHYHRLALSN